MKSRAIALAALAVMLLLAACQQPGPGAKPTISTFTAKPATINAGQSATLSWKVTGATSLKINNGVGNVTSKKSVTVKPTKTTTYTLTATNSAGSVNKTATVTVNTTPPPGAPVINSFTANPATINSGSGGSGGSSPSSTLSWDVTGADSLTLSNNVNNNTQDVTGQNSVTVTPTQTTTYTLTATNEVGSAHKTATVTVNTAPPPPGAPTINSFTANPTSISGGGSSSSTLSWDVTDATSLSIDNGVGDVTGQTSVMVSPTATTTYTLTAANNAGSVTAEATVTVNTAPPPPPSGGAFSQVFSDTPAGVGATANFGLAVAVDGDTMVVGAPFQSKYLPPPDDSYVDQSGVAYVYTNNGGTWGPDPSAVLTADDAVADDNFGTSVAIHGGTILVGAPGHAVMGGTPPASQDRAGAVYVFTSSGSTWAQAAELTEADASTVSGFSGVATGDQFGFSVAIDSSGTTFVTGANQCPGATDIKTASLSPQALNNCGPNGNGTGTGPGKAYVFTGSGSTWTAQAQLDNSSDSTSRDGDDFGYTASITTDSSGTEVIALGSHGNGLYGDGSPNADNGAVYLFTSSDGTTWTQAVKLLPSDSQAADYFGRSVSLSGDTLLVGSVRYQGTPSSSGAAYVFDGSNGWNAPTPVKELFPDDPATNKYFGFYVALDGDIAVIGSLDQDTADGGAGSVYVFGRNTGGADNWGQVQKLTASDASPSAQFSRVAISGQTIVVGSPTQTVNGASKGEVYVFAPPAP